jgi:hypothetical protein
MKQQSTVRLVTVAFVLAISFGVTWGFGLGWVGSFVQSLIGQSDLNDYEDIVVDHYGNPFIQVRVGGDYESIQHRTLAGKFVEFDSADTFSPSRLSAHYRAPRLFEYPITWRERIAGMSSGEKPPVSWVFLRNDSRPGKAYFVGYHPKSKQRAGYIGRRGSRTSLPPDEEQFDVGEPGFAYDTNLMASTSSINIGALGYGYSSITLKRAGQLEPSQVFLCDGSVVREVNLRTREVRVVKEFDKLIGVAILGFTPLDALRTDDRWPEQRLIVRCQDRLIVYNTINDTEVEFKIPADLQDESLGINSVGAGELLLHVNRGKWERGQVVDLVRINPAGEIQEQQTVQLVSYVSDDTAAFSLIPASIVPTLLPWCLGMFVVAPLSMMQSHSAPDYAAGLQIAWETAWLGFLLVFVISVILTAVVYRWQKEYSRPNTVAWTSFVFLTTLPGFLAYWAMHRWAPLAECPHCGKEVPLNREACARCAEPFPEPKLLGTEVFA